MLTRITAALALCALAVIPAAARQDRAHPNVTEFTLQNGMRTVVIEDHRAPVATHMVWYRIGAADEPPGKSGIAHFLEHLMFKGTEKLGSGEFSQIIAANGGQDNAFTSRDYTAYFQRIAKDQLELVMALEADRMTNLLLSEEDVRTERDVILEERNTRTDNSPQSQFYEDFMAALYLNHPYGIPVIGWRHEMETLTRQDALNFYQAFYAPDNALLVVAGDVEPDQVRVLAEKHYGSIPARAVEPAERPAEPPHRTERRLHMMHSRVAQPSFSRVYLVPSYRQSGVQAGSALDLFADILGGGVTSRLYQALVQEQKIALNAGAYYSGMTRDDGLFGLYATPAEGVSLQKLEAEIDRILAAFSQEGPTQEELDRFRYASIASQVYQQDSQASMARLYGGALSVGLTVEQLHSWPQLVKALSTEEVRQAGAILDRRASVTGWLEPETQAKAVMPEAETQEAVQ